MPVNIYKTTRARNIFYTDVLLNGSLKVQFAGKGLRKDMQVKALSVKIPELIRVKH